MDHFINRPNSCVKNNYETDRKIERIFIDNDYDIEEMKNEEFEKEEIKKEDMIGLFKKNIQKVNKIDLYDRNEGKFVLKQKILIGICYFCYVRNHRQLIIRFKTNLIKTILYSL